MEVPQTIATIAGHGECVRLDEHRVGDESRRQLLARESLKVRGRLRQLIVNFEWLRCWEGLLILELRARNELD